MRRAGLPEEYAAALDNGLWASVDTLPAEEVRRSGIALQQSRTFWQPESLQQDAIRQLWPPIKSPGVGERVSAF